MADGIDLTCIDCAHMHRDREGGRWCQSPQIIAFLGNSLRCVWERDSVPSSERGPDPSIRKCGPNARNFKLKEAW